jgi:transcription elongation factor GreA
MSGKSPMTVNGAEQLRKELQELKNVRRPQVIQAIAEARAHGDLKENAEYHAAKEQQGFIEGRIAEIETKLSHAEIIDVSKLSADGTVVFGVKVELYNTETDQELSYRIVGEDEADIKAGLLSVGSPMARALIGRKEGDVTIVKTPNGDVEYEIVAVHFEA